MTTIVELAVKSNTLQIVGPVPFGFEKLNGLENSVVHLPENCFVIGGWTKPDLPFSYGPPDGILSLTDSTTVDPGKTYELPNNTLNYLYNFGGGGHSIGEAGHSLYVKYIGASPIQISFTTDVNTATAVINSGSFSDFLFVNNIAKSSLVAKELAGLQYPTSLDFNLNLDTETELSGVFYRCKTGELVTYSQPDQRYPISGNTNLYFAILPNPA